MKHETCRVVVVGGGFGGLYAASYLSCSETARRRELQVTLVDPRNYFTFTPLLAEVAGGSLGREHVTYPFRTLALERRFAFAHDRAVDLDLENRRVLTRHTEFPYDYVVLATGAGPRYFGNDDLQRETVPFTEVEDALHVRSRVIDSLERALVERDEQERRRLLTFVVAGGGPAGIEIASEIHDLLCDPLAPHYPVEDAQVVAVVGGSRILRGYDERLADEGLRILRRRGIRVILNTHVTGYENGCVQINGDGAQHSIPAGTLIWTAGTTPGEWLSNLELPTARGALAVDNHLRVKGRQREFAIGDAAHLVDSRTGRPYPRVAPIAISQGIRAAANIENAVIGRDLEPYHATHAGKIVSLGGGTALVEILGVRLTGRLAWMAYRTAYLLKLVGLSNKVRVAVTLFLNRVFGRDIGYEEGRARLSHGSPATGRTSRE